MSTNRKTAPLATHRDGQTFTKVWGNENADGQVRYTSTVGYTYTDKETGEPKESRNLRDSDLLRLPSLAARARESIRLFKTRDRVQAHEDQAVSEEREVFRQARQQGAPARGESQGPQL